MFKRKIRCKIIRIQPTPRIDPAIFKCAIDYWCENPNRNVSIDQVIMVITESNPEYVTVFEMDIWYFLQRWMDALAFFMNQSI